MELTQKQNSQTKGGAVLMMIGIGKLKDNFEVAISDRISVEEIIEKYT